LSRRRNREPRSQKPRRESIRRKSPPATSVESKTSSTNILVRASHFEGPLPPPEILHGYEVVLPGAADRIIQMAEVEGQERRSRQEKRLTAEIATEKRGQYLSFCLAGGVCTGGIYLLALGQPIHGLVALLTPLAGLAGMFIFAKRQGRVAPQEDKGLKNK
jgi:uncharacterized membrane protein